MQFDPMHNTVLKTTHVSLAPPLTRDLYQLDHVHSVSMVIVSFMHAQQF